MGNPAHGEAACVRYGKATAHNGEKILRGSGRRGETEIVAHTAELEGISNGGGRVRPASRRGGVRPKQRARGDLGPVRLRRSPRSRGLVLTRRAHEEFLRTSGALRDIRAATKRGEDARQRAEVIRSRHVSYPIEGGLNRAICKALVELNARAVIVLSADFARGGLRSIPEVKDAVRDAWLTLRGLERQVDAAAQGEDPPTWPLLVYPLAKI
jgi:hypothetical protein